MEQQLTCELNGIKYLLIRYLMTDNPKIKMEELFKKYDVIVQGVEKVHVGILSKTYAIVNILVPEHNVIAFNKEDNEF